MYSRLSLVVSVLVLAFILPNTYAHEENRISICMSGGLSTDVKSCGEDCYLHSHPVTVTVSNQAGSRQVGTFDMTTRVQADRGYYRFNFTSCCTRTCDQLNIGEICADDVTSLYRPIELRLTQNIADAIKATAPDKTVWAIRSRLVDIRTQTEKRLDKITAAIDNLQPGVAQCKSTYSKERSLCIDVYRNKYEQCKQRQVRKADEFCDRYEERMAQCAELSEQKEMEECFKSIRNKYNVSIRGCREKYEDYLIEGGMAYQIDPCEIARDKKCPPVYHQCDEGKLQDLKNMAYEYRRSLEKLADLEFMKELQFYTCEDPFVVRNRPGHLVCTGPGDAETRICIYGIGCPIFVDCKLPLIDLR